MSINFAKARALENITKIGLKNNLCNYVEGKVYSIVENNSTIVVYDNENNKAAQFSIHEVNKYFKVIHISRVVGEGFTNLDIKHLQTSSMP